MALARSSPQAAASSSQPLDQSSSSTSHNKEFSVLSDEHLFSKFVDAETFDFSDSSYDRSTSADISDRDSWFEEPFTSTSNGLVGLPTEIVTPPNELAEVVDFENKTFLLDEELEYQLFGEPFEPLLDVDIQEEVLRPSTPEPEASIRAIPSTVVRARGSQSQSVKRSGRRRQSVDSPTMGKNTSRKGKESSINPHSLTSAASARYGFVSPPATVTQHRYWGTNQQHPVTHRMTSHSSQLSPLSQYHPPQQQQQAQMPPYFSPMASPMFADPSQQTYARPQLSSVFDDPPNFDAYFSSDLTGLPSSTLPTFSDPFPPGDLAWEHDLNNQLGGGLSMRPEYDFLGTGNDTCISQLQGYNDTKVQPWAPPAPPLYNPQAATAFHAQQQQALRQQQQQHQQVPMTAPLMSTQHEHYASTPTFPHHPPPHHQYTHPKSTHPASSSNNFSSQPLYHPQATHTAPLLAGPKVRRSKQPTPIDLTLPDRSRRSGSPSASSRPRSRTTRSARTGAPASSSRLQRQHRDLYDRDDNDEDSMDDVLDYFSSSEDEEPVVAQSRGKEHARSQSRSQAPRTSRHHTSSHRKGPSSSTPLSPIAKASSSRTKPSSKSHTRSRSTHILDPPPKSTSSRTTTSRSKRKADPFINLTSSDHRKILTGVAPSGSSKTKAKREKEAREAEEGRRKEVAGVAVRAVRVAGGNVEVFEREVGRWLGGG